MNRSALALALFTLACATDDSATSMDEPPRKPQVILPAPARPAGPAAEAGGGRGERTAGDILPYEATETTLENGLVVIVVPTGMPNLVSLQIPVQTGSRNEVEPGKTGFAHFFEHMMFRGTERYPPAAYESILTNAGARQNAYTTDDYTNYHVTFALEDLEKILEIEADRFQNLSYSEEAFRTEALAVLGEYNKNFANPIQKLFEVMRERAYQVHPYKHTTMGFLEDIQAMPDQSEYAKTFFDRWYRPEKTAIVLVGDVEPDRAIELVRRYWGDWERGGYEAEIPAEPPPRGPVHAHVEWTSPTNPLLAVGFHGPAFSTTEPNAAALGMIGELFFGETSEVYQRLVVDEQRVDFLAFGNAADEDPSLALVLARVKEPSDVAYVRDRILETAARARAEAVDAGRLEEAKSNLRYSFAATLDNAEAIASTLATFVRFDREYDTINDLYRVYARLEPGDLLRAARTYLTDERLVVTTLSHGPLDPPVAEQPRIASFAPPAPGDVDLDVVAVRTKNPQLSIKLLFETGSASDPEGKEGLAALAAAMVAEAGSERMRYEEIQKALFPIAGRFDAQVDKEMTTFTGSIHRDNLDRFLEVALPMLTRPGFRQEDFTRLVQNQRNALVIDLRSNNDEELGKEALQANLFPGTPYEHPWLGTVAGIDSIGLDDVKDFVARNYTRAKLTVGLAGDVPGDLERRLERELAILPAGAGGVHMASARRAPEPRVPEGIEVEIIAKDTRATAISFGFPIEVTRSHPDYVPLYVARTWLGEHRSSMSHLYQRIRELRGMNYGDYAYIEAFPGGMFRFFPQPNRARLAQIFEVWIRPVKPEQAHHALRIAIFELAKLVDEGLSQEDFEATREYLSKNVFLMTSTQEQQLGYALDSRFYGIPEYTEYVRNRLAKLTLEDTNRAIREHLSPESLSVVFVTKDADTLKQELLSDEPSAIAYESQKPPELLEEDALIGAMKLSIRPERLRVTPVEAVFAE